MQSIWRASPGWLAPALLALLALLHGALYAWLVPPWQMPDEPTQFEYAALASRLSRVPVAADADPALERQIVDSLVRQRFFDYLVGHGPDRPLRSMEDARQLFFMPRQVGADPPLYFAIAALPIWLLSSQPIESQLLALRLLGALFTAGVAACVYGAARELFDHRPPATDGRRSTSQRQNMPGESKASVTLSPSHPLTAPGRPAIGGGWPGAPLAAGLLAALHPMVVFVGAGAGNDGLANLIGAAFCWALLRSLRLGTGRRRAAALLALALLGILTKRTLLAQALLLALLGVWLAARSLARLRQRRSALLGLGALAIALLAGVAGALAAGRAADTAADWTDVPSAADARRVPAAPQTGQAALELRPANGALQALPGVGAEWVQNQELRFSARVWTSAGSGRGRLKIDFGWAATEVPFKANARGRVVDVHTFVPLFCPYVFVAVYSDSGTIYADQLRAESGRRPGLNVLANGDLAKLSVHAGAPLAWLSRYLRLRELAWIWRSGRLLEPPPLGWDLGRIFFVSFWGQFGWMSLPLVGATPWEGGLALLCAGGLIGSLARLASARPAWRRQAIALLLALVLAGLLFPLLNAYTQTRDQVIQQGRYLFPMLAPIALALVLGWRGLLAPRWRRAALLAWAAWWVSFAIAALALLVRFYYRG